MIKIAVGMILGLLIGSACRWFDIPLPSPPKLVGVLLIASITFGYVATDKIMSRLFNAKGPAANGQLCGGPSGELKSRQISI